MNSGGHANANLKVIAGDSFACDDVRIREYRCKWRDNPSSHTVERFPLHLDVESTSVCNLRCPFCAGTHEEYSRGHMPIERFKSIVDEGATKGLYAIKLNFRGEPLLHPRIDELVAYAKERGIADVFFNTNATRLTEEVGGRLIAAGLDRLIVSFEGWTRETYESNRVGAGFDEVVGNIRRFADLKRRLGNGRPALRLQTVELAEIEGYAEKYREFWKDWADEITCIDRRDELADYSSLQVPGWECTYPWQRLCITWEGAILPCPFMNRSLEKYEWRGFGNADSVTVEEAWRSPDMSRIRSAHTEGMQHLIEPCRFCSHRGSELSKLQT